MNNNGIKALNRLFSIIERENKTSMCFEDYYTIYGALEKNNKDVDHDNLNIEIAGFIKTLELMGFKVTQKKWRI